MKIAFIWQGFDGRYGQWRDGLYAAMKILEQSNEVRYFDFPLTSIDEFEPDVVLYWEAPVCQRGKDAENWKSVVALPYPKALLFAGGPLKAMDVKDFNLVFVESEINEEDCEREGIPYRRAFGVNTQIFKPIEKPKKYLAFMQATFAGWKRHELFASAVGSQGALAGRKQEHDTNGYNSAVKNGVTIFDEQPAENVAELIAESCCVLNTAEYWGGGQRCTLEAMACGVPVVVMADAPKNVEFVNASGAGVVAEPDVESIRTAIKKTQQHYLAMSTAGVDYMHDNWTEQHYADALINGVRSIL